MRSGRTKELVLPLAALGLACMLGRACDRSADAPVQGTDASRPAYTPAAAARERRSRRARNARASAPPPAGAKTPQTYLVVQVRDPSHGLSILMPAAPFDPGRWWPMPEIFGDHPAATSFEDLLAGELQEEAWVEEARAQGLGTDEVDTTDPWVAVLALEVERRAAILERRERADEVRADLDPTHQATDAWLAGSLDTAPLVALAEEIIASHPDHPAAEYARLYAVEGASAQVRDGTPSLKLQARSRALALARDMLQHTEDPLVAGQALERIIGLDSEDGLHTEDLDALERRLDEAPDAVAELPVTALGLDQALRWGDPERIEAWAARYDAAIAVHCAGALDHDALAACATHTDNRDETLGALGLRDPGSAEDWKQAWTLAAHACAREVHFEELSLRGEWGDGEWQFASDQSSLGSPFATCLIERAQAGPSPEGPARLLLRVIGEAQPVRVGAP